MEREFEMRIPVCKYLIGLGYSPVMECQSLRNCDIVAIKYTPKPMVLTEMVAVELKLTKVKEVYRQCVNHIGRANEVWAALRADAAERVGELFSEKGIGVLAVDSSGVRVVIPAERREGIDLQRWKNLIRRRDEYKDRMKDPLMICRRSKAIAAAKAWNAANTNPASP